MSNIPEHIKNISELKEKRNGLVQQVQDIDNRIRDIYSEWQQECSHPQEYRVNNDCTACGYSFPESE